MEDHGVLGIILFVCVQETELKQHNQSVTACVCLCQDRAVPLRPRGDARMRFKGWANDDVVDVQIEGKKEDGGAVPDEDLGRCDRINFGV